MPDFKRFVAALSASAVSILGFTFTASAQSADKYIQVGTDDSGEPVLLETRSIYGKRQKLLQKYGTGMKETDFHASCAERRFWINRVAVYDGAGNLLTEDRKSTEIPVQPDSIAANALRTSCHEVHAQGW